MYLVLEIEMISIIPLPHETLGKAYSVTLYFYGSIDGDLVNLILARAEIIL